jgi:hypothetical protein
MVIICGTGDEKPLEEMTDEELIAERNFWNSQLKPMFYTSSATYDIGANIVKEIEREMNRREHEGPPWTINEE